jgi:hypothetical protein
VLSDAVRLPHRLRQQGLRGLEPDIFIADLAGLGLDPRTERSLGEAIESYPARRVPGRRQPARRRYRGR